jgi:hypothetical protein
MKFREQIHAENLRVALLGALDGIDAAISVSGQGSNWSCSVELGSRACVVHCFDSKGARYLTGFQTDQQEAAWGRTSSQADTIAATLLWIEGASIDIIRAQFPFIDQQQRAFHALWERVLQNCPRLLGATSQNRQLTNDLYELWVADRDRSCRIYFYGDDAFPRCEFHWDGCELFAFVADDIPLLADVLARWIIDHATPSALASDFPWIQMRKAARYYEEGRGVEGEFIESWDSMERMYEEMQSKLGPAIRAFLADLRQRGYDSKLRAGQSMWTFIVSRSRRHGLRRGKPFIEFRFQDEGMQILGSMGGIFKLSRKSIAFDHEIEQLLTRLLQEPID